MGGGEREEGGKGERERDIGGGREGRRERTQRKAESRDGRGRERGEGGREGRENTKREGRERKRERERERERGGRGEETRSERERVHVLACQPTVQDPSADPQSADTLSESEPRAVHQWRLNRRRATAVANGIRRRDHHQPRAVPSHLHLLVEVEAAGE